VSAERVVLDRDDEVGLAVAIHVGNDRRHRREAAAVDERRRLKDRRCLGLARARCERDEEGKRDDQPGRKGERDRRAAGHETLDSQKMPPTLHAESEPPGTRRAKKATPDYFGCTMMVPVSNACASHVKV
jgi:hypothetical protein